MKKAFKTLIILVLVGLSIGGTCYLFYANLVRQQDAYSRINMFIYGADKVSIDANVAMVNTQSDNRLTIAITTANKLDDITKTLNTYMIRSLDFDVDNNEIIARLESANEKRNELNLEAEEFILKMTNEYFNKSYGANDIMRTFSNYIIRYANMIQYMNNEICENIVENKNVDIKFDLIDLYCRTAINTFSNLGETLGLIGVKDNTNINLLNNKFNIKNGMIVSVNASIGSELSHINNKFIECYNTIDKDSFANELYSNVNTVNTLDDNSTNVQKATYYLKQILGL